MLGLDGGKWRNVEDLLLDLRVEQCRVLSVLLQGNLPRLPGPAAALVICPLKEFVFPVRVNQSFPFPHLSYQLLLVTPGAQHELSLLLSWLEGTWRGLGKRLQQFRPKAGCVSAGIIFM